MQDKKSKDKSASEKRKGHRESEKKDEKKAKKKAKKKALLRLSLRWTFGRAAAARLELMESRMKDPLLSAASKPACQQLVKKRARWCSVYLLY